MRKLALSAALLAATPAFAEAPKNRCIPTKDAQKFAADAHNKWIELGPAQWEFMRGIYAGNPNTPPGLPVGNKAVLVRSADSEHGLVFFIDGSRACWPLSLPKAGLKMLDDIATDVIPHEGNEL